MPTTPLGFTYPADTDGPFGPLQIQQALTDVDTYLSLFVWRARRFATAFSIADGSGDGSYHSVPMDTLDLISSSGATLGTGANTGFCAVPATGRYLVAGVISFSANSTGLRGAAVAVNGSPIDGDYEQVAAATGGPTRLPVAADIVFCSAGDVISIQAFQSSTAALNTAVAGPCRLLVARYPG